MVFMNMLRLVIDISFYYSFSSVVVACLFKKYVAMGMLISLVPVLVYVLGVILSKNFVLSWHRQIDIFTVFWKAYLGFGFVVCLMGAYQEFLWYSVPFAIVVICVSILFLRMLRHEPEVYLNREYQVKNIVLLAGIVLIAWLFSQKFVLFPIKYVLNFLYVHLIVPVLAFFSVGLGIVVANVMGVYAKLLSWMQVDSRQIMSVLYSQSEMENKVHNIAKESSFSSSHWILLGAVAIIIGLIFFFRWLNQKWKPQTMRVDDVAMEVKMEEIHDIKEHSSLAVHQVRRQYRKFLKLYKAKGYDLQVCDTSEDISKKSEGIVRDADILAEMREIYIRARYANQATKADIKKLKQMNHILKK